MKTDEQIADYDEDGAIEDAKDPHATVCPRCGVTAPMHPLRDPYWIDTCDNIFICENCVCDICDRKDVDRIADYYGG